MTPNKEIQDVIDHIPQSNEYPNSILQISIPTTSMIEPSDVMKVVYEHALPKGWDIGNITLIRKSGYIACNDCKKNLHVHVSNPSKVWCMNCSNKNISRTEAKVSVVKKNS